jgi:signal transduction histidine kinase
LELKQEGRTFTKEELNLLSILSTDIAQLIEDAHLFEQAKLLIATEERNRLARELHDSVAQALYSINLFSDATHLALENDRIEAVKNNLRELILLSRQAMMDMRLLIFELRPPDLEHAGLAASLRSRLETVEFRAGIQAVFHAEGELSLSSAEESELYRIAQEALNNVIKHARASQVKIQLTGEEGCIRLVIEDDGIGFDVEAEGSGGQGLRNIRERAEKIGATCWIESVPGQGTIVNVEVNK